MEQIREDAKNMFLAHYGLEDWAPINTHLYFDDAPIWALELLMKVLKN